MSPFQAIRGNTLQDIIARVLRHTQYTKFLIPGELFSVCYKAPLIRGKLPSQNIIWKVSNKYSEFQ